MSRSTSGSTSSGLAKGKNFIKKLLYVQHVDEEKDTVSEIPDRYLEELINPYRTNFHTEYLKSPKENLSILKSSMEDSIDKVTVYSNPLPMPLQLKDVTIHAFVVLETYFNMWWSIEKNGHHIVLQQSSNKDDVIDKLYDTEKKTSVERLGPIKTEISDITRKYTNIYQKRKYINKYQSEYRVRDLIRIIVDTNMLNESYHLLFSNCQIFASFVFEKLSGKNKWSTMTSAIGDRIGLINKKIQLKIKVNAVKYKSILYDQNFELYRAMMEGRREDFEELTNNLTIECLNSVDSQGYTLLEWATVFKSSDWPIDEELKKKGAQNPSDEKLLKLFFIALQYLPPIQKSKFLSFDGIDIHGVNQTGDTALHLALYGGKWGIAVKILNRFENYDVNRTNSSGDTPLLLATSHNCQIVHNCKRWFICFFFFLKKILKRTNSENVNKTDRNGNTALHNAISNECKIATKALLARSDVNVDIKNKDHESALLLASTEWKDFPSDLLKLILEKSKEINAQDIYGWTALHYAIDEKSKITTKALLSRSDVDVNVRNNCKKTALHLAFKWKDIPVDLFKIILEKSGDINAQYEYGNTALHLAIRKKSEIAVKELLAHNDVDVNIKNNSNYTLLHYASMWTNIPSDLFNLILQKSTDVNAQNYYGNTALHYAIDEKYEIATKALLAHNDVDVKVKNNDNETGLHFASKWPNIPADLFKLILEKSTDINAQDEDGWTALHLAIRKKSEIAVKELLAHKDVNVNVKNKDNETALHLASKWTDIPVDLFNLILQKSTNVINAQNNRGNTALHCAIICKSEIAAKKLLAHKDVDVNIKNNNNETALGYVSEWKNIPSDLFKIISERSANDAKEK